MLFFAFCVALLPAAKASLTEDFISSPVSSCAATEESIERNEASELEAVQLELLQLNKKSEPSPSERGEKPPDRWHSDTESIGGDHRYLLVRPCARFAGDGLSGLPRHRVTGECCGDAICSTDRWESFDTCPQDCKSETKVSESTTKARAVLPPTNSSLFGTLEGMEHDEYHCEGGYDENNTWRGMNISNNPCSSMLRFDSRWLESLLERSEAGTLPFALPPPGSIAVEFGCGLGQDSRNMAAMAGYAVTSIDVSPSGIEEAKSYTPADQLGPAAGQIEFIAYDAMALPVPKKRVDFVFDATVYCGLRHAYLSRDYDVWSRIATPGHTLVHIQCWNFEEDTSMLYKIPRTRRDMEADFEPIFDVLHSESCEKNQHGPGWCFYLMLKDPAVINKTFDDRLELQAGVRRGDDEFVQGKIQDRLEQIPDAEFKTLYYIAQANRHLSLMSYLRSFLTNSDDPFFKELYGVDADAKVVAAEDAQDGGENIAARLETSYMKADWERAESQLAIPLKDSHA